MACLWSWKRWCRSRSGAGSWGTNFFLSLYRAQIGCGLELALQIFVDDLIDADFVIFLFCPALEREIARVNVGDQPFAHHDLVKNPLTERNQSAIELHRLLVPDHGQLKLMQLK